MAPSAIVSPRPPDPVPSLKRQSSDLNADCTNSSPEYPSKRPRVTFSEHVEVKTQDELGERTPAMIREEIRAALKQHDEGNHEAYDRVKAVFTEPPESEDAAPIGIVRNHLLALISCATALRKSYSDLVFAVLNMRWLNQEDSFISLYTRFLGTLVSSNGGYIGQALNMLVSNFAHISSSAGPSPGRTLEQRLRYQARVHTAVKYLLQLVPTASSVLASIISSSFPFPTDSKKAHVEYVRNILRITEYAPELKGEVLDLISDRVVKIDVQVQVDVEDIEEDVERALDQDSGPVDYTLPIDAGDVSDAESVVSDDDDDLDPEEQRFREIKASVEKMDAMLDQLFAYHTTVLANKSPVQNDAMFKQLLSQFSKVILPAHRSRHTQFLQFHFAQASRESTLKFAKHCITILKDKSYTPVLRRSAAAYVASFTARGAKVTTEVVVSVFHALAQYLNLLRYEMEPSCKGPDMRKYIIYYATAQALIYIFCFRWRDLLAHPEEYEDDDYEDLFDGRALAWSPNVREVFSQNFTSKLNPLKVCAPEVVEEFAKIAKKLNFYYAYNILDDNKRITLSHSTGSFAATSALTRRETSLMTLQGERHHQLDDYFPFDPYRLPVSKRWLVGDYNDWKGLPDQDEHDSSEDAAWQAGDEMDDDVGSGVAFEQDLTA